MHHWLLGSTLATLGRRTAAAWRALPWMAIVRQVVGTAVAFAVAMGFTAAVTLLARANVDAGLHQWDAHHLVLIRDAEGWASNLPFGFTDGIIFESPTNILILLPVTALCAVVAAWHGRLLLAVQFVLCYGLGRLLIWAGWWLWARPRPDLIADGAAALSAHSFPSGHGVLVLTTYGLLALLWARHSLAWGERILAGLALALLAAVVGYGRLLLGAHWPSDVIAGWAIGLVWLTGNAVVLHYAEQRATAGPENAGLPQSSQSSQRVRQ